ncbi:hypothetical protein IFR05_002891 [Cadophora sp. M221]|nr:hypothetical protein IFR05_002891 [Cadophora sp. M221]
MLITDAIATYGEPEDADTRWNDVDSKNETDHIVIKKPKFHLLIPTNKPSANLCKTLLSAAILNYPPPMLISYGESPDSERPGMDVVKNTFSFLLGKEVHDGDLILIIDEDTIFQLSPSVTISRFIHTSQDTSTKLLSKYGRVPNTNGTTIPKSQRAPKYTQKILFGATKSCSSPPDDPACHSIPDSSLPKSTYSSLSNNHTETTNTPPHHITLTLLIGRASSLRPFYKHLSELLEFSPQGIKGSHQTITQIYREQEHARSLFLSSSRPDIPAWRQWISSIFTNTKPNPSLPTNPSNQTPTTPQTQNQIPNHESEFGISLDYHTFIFQAMRSSSDDLEIIQFDQTSNTTKGPSKSQAASYRIKRPIHLPADLENVPPPLFSAGIDTDTDVENENKENISHDTCSPDESRKGNEKDKDKEIDAKTPHPWSSLPLWTNTRVPTSSVPAMLGFHNPNSNTDTNTDIEGMELTTTWSKMWFHNTSLSLPKEHLTGHGVGSAGVPISIDAGERWFDVRGGRRGEEGAVRYADEKEHAQEDEVKSDANK